MSVKVKRSPQAQFIIDTLRKVLPDHHFSEMEQLPEKLKKEMLLECRLNFPFKYTHEHSPFVDFMARVVGRQMEFTWKVYLTIHIIPILIFKRKQLKKKPFRTFLKFLKNYAKSMGFITFYCTFFKLGLSSFGGMWDLGSSKKNCKF